MRKNRPLNGTARRGRGSRPCQGAFRSRLACRTEADLRRSTVDGVRKGHDGARLVAESPGKHGPNAPVWGVVRCYRTISNEI